MASVLRSMLPLSSPKRENRVEEYSVEYSFALEYSGPPISGDIPQLIPIDVRRIPTAAVATRAAMSTNLSLPVIQPIPRKTGLSSGTGKFGGPSRVYSTKSEDCSKDGALDASVSVGSESNGQSSSSSGTLSFSDGPDESNQASGSSDVDDMDDEPNTTTLKSNPEVEVEMEGSARRATIQANRIPVVTFRDMPPSSHSVSEESDLDGPEVLPERPAVVAVDRKKGLCNKCGKKNRFSEKEFCIVCGAKYCGMCVLRAMGSMPEGRKCITCIGYPIEESNRESLGKCSRMLKKLFTDEAINQIMKAEISCEVNQLPPHLVCVNNKPLSIEELVMLQSCANPPKKLKPGKYWYDKVSGFWGKDGEKPSQIISAQLAVGYQISTDASNGKTNVKINNREITKSELWMLQTAGIHCEGHPHFWITADGSFQLEGMNYVMGKLWDKKIVRIVCAALSLPFPSDIANFGGEGVNKEGDSVPANNLEQRLMNRFLLIGCQNSGTSTIYKQARILYGVPFSEDEKKNIKIIIQRNLYRYIAIMLDAREHFEEDQALEIRRKRVVEPGPSTSGNSEQVDKKKVYSFSPKLEAFASWLLQVMILGNLEAIFPAATREYAPMIEELWKDKAFQAIYKRRNELNTLPRVANYFLDRAVEISQIDYEPSEMDILYAEGITSSNGVASMEFSFPVSPDEGYMESLDQNDHPMSYQLIRVPASSLGENGKWLEMFEDVDLVLYCVSMTSYDEYYEDLTGECTNKMMVTMEHFQSIVTHPTLAEKDFLLILNKYDLLDDKIEKVPLTQCEWFHDFQPVISLHPHKPSSNNNPSLAQRTFHYMAVKFKRLFSELTERKLYVSMVTGLEADTVDKALRYGKEVLKWDYEGHTTNEYSTESIDPSQSM